MINHAPETADSAELPVESVFLDGQTAVDSPDMAKLKQEAADLAAYSVAFEERKMGRVPTLEGIRNRVIQRYRYILGAFL